MIRFIKWRMKCADHDKFAPVTTTWRILGLRMKDGLYYGR
jgi:hypothetical protein